MSSHNPQVGDGDRLRLRAAPNMRHGCEDLHRVGLTGVNRNDSVGGGPTLLAQCPGSEHNHVRSSFRCRDGRTDDHYRVTPVGWVDYTGSGVETIAHLRENGRICVMFASFDHRPRVVRLHGRGMVGLPGEAAYEELVALHPAHPGTRAVVVVDVERVSESCGYGVPVMNFVEERGSVTANG